MTVEEMMAMRRAVQEAESNFFLAWRDGVAVARYAFFGDGTEAGFKRASTKNDLRPNQERILNAGYLSQSEKKFLLALYSFFNDQAAVEMAKEMNVCLTPNPDGLDGKRVSIITRLATSYRGW